MKDIKRRVSYIIFSLIISTSDLVILTIFAAIDVLIRISSRFIS